MPRPVAVTVRISPDPGAVARAAAEFFVHTVAAVVKSRGVARVAVSGGSTPRGVFKLLATENRDQVSWSQLQLFWVDERSVAPDDAESNYGMTRDTLLAHVPLPAANIHRMEGELDPQEAASRYESEIRNTFKLEGAETPTFDLIFLGLGPDGHTASLFPHTEGLNEMARICMANHVPQKDTWRLTLTWPVITQGREVVFLIEGAEKAAMVRTVFLGAYDPEAYPAQLIRPANGRLTLLLDPPAASELPQGSPDGVTTLELS
jgi:6-phosphogluconolactonase